jgi:hypothetical protein
MSNNPSKGKTTTAGVENINSRGRFDAKGMTSDQVKDKNQQSILSADDSSDDFVFDYN